MATTRLTTPQLNCLWGLAIGSKGLGSNRRTLESLRRRGLATVRSHQGALLWEATPDGEGVIDRERGRA